MEEKILDLLSPFVNEKGMVIDSVVYEKDGSINFLRIALDRDEIISLDEIVLITRIINPVLDKASLIESEYVLDVYAKSKGDV